MTAQRPTTTTIAILGANTVVEKVLALLLEGAMAPVLGPAEGEG